jgi:16S rRNA processing protein RimM
LTRYVLIGAIARPHGVKGDVQVVPFHAESPLWRVGSEIAVLARHMVDRAADTVEADNPPTIRIKRIGSGPKGRFIVWFDGISDRFTAERQKGAWLAAAADDLGELAEDEFWYHEIAGWDVCSTTSEPLGRVVRIIDGATDLLEVRPIHGGETYFIPMVGAFIVDIDRGASRVVVDPIEGLIP